MERKILHLSLPSFPLQVLVADRRKFRDRPAALAGADTASARVLSLNPRAFGEGLRRGMTLAEALRRCAALSVFTPRPDLFSRAHQQLRELLGRYSPVVEPGRSSFYLDLTGTSLLLGPGPDAAAKILREMDSSMSLVSSAGLAASKLVGTAASSLASAPGLAAVLAEEEAVFLRPFPLRKILGKEPWLAERLEELGFRFVSDLQGLSRSELTSAFGKDGLRLHLISRGIDHSPVVPSESFPELDEGESLAEASNDLELLRLTLWRLSERLGRRLRERRTSAGLLRLLVVYRDGAFVVRRLAFKKPTALDRELNEAGLKLLAGAFSRRVQLIYLGLRASRLTSGFQPDLFGGQEAKSRLYTAIDRIRLRYGDSAIRFGIEPCPA
jgi:DNA polymerase-4